jgi:hypothetical protein
MREHLNSRLAEVGESFDALRADVRRLGRYAAELEDLIESYRAFVEGAALPHAADRQLQRRLLRRTLTLLGSALAASEPDAAPLPAAKLTCSAAIE